MKRQLWFHRVKGRLVILLALIVLTVGAAAALTNASAQPRPTAPPPGANKISPQEQAKMEQLARSQVEQFLRRQPPRPTVVSIADSTRGKPIVIAGKPVLLPPDTYVEAWRTDVVCVEGQLCPETPDYIIVRGNSRISVGAAAGRINYEQVAPGHERAFDFLTEALR
jgi:hypothetical protein